jgi:hypothetical protein
MHIVKQYKPPHSRTQTRNVLVLPFTAVVIGIRATEGVLTNTYFTRMPNTSSSLLKRTTVYPLRKLHSSRREAVALIGHGYTSSMSMLGLLAFAPHRCHPPIPTGFGRF